MRRSSSTRAWRRHPLPCPARPEITGTGRCMHMQMHMQTNSFRMLCAASVLLRPFGASCVRRTGMLVRAVQYGPPSNRRLAIHWNGRVSMHEHLGARDWTLVDARKHLPGWTLRARCEDETRAGRLRSWASVWLLSLFNSEAAGDPVNCLCGMVSVDAIDGERVSRVWIYELALSSRIQTPAGSISVLQKSTLRSTPLLVG
ncbi:hypothetical protein HDV57DRAFT_424508 [Trichoderma longibrachiatum]